MPEAWIIDAARTPRGIGKVGKGSLADVHPQRVLSPVLKELAERNNLATEDIDDVIAGCGSQVGRQGACIARMAALDAGYSEKATGFSLDRFCGSGLTSVNLGAMGIMSGMQNLIVAGGVESMSYAGTYARESGGEPMPSLDRNNQHLRDMHPQPHQGVCADLIGTLEGITRAETEEHALESQKRASNAIKNGYFDNALVPVLHDDGSVALDHEEFPRPETTLEGLAQLKPSFEAMYQYPLDEAGLTYKKLVQQAYPDLEITHNHHAGNSSGVVDGAGALVLASPDYAKAHGLKPRAKITVTTADGDSPTTMLNAPVPAARKALDMAGLTVDDIDLWEINEAFAVVSLRFMRMLGLDYDKVNVNGGAMALGHPIGATGAIILGTLLDEMERRDLHRGMATMCTGGGMAPATIIERM